VAKKTIEIENGTQVDAPLGEVVGIEVENDQRRRMHSSGEGSGTTHGGHGRVCGHGWQRKTVTAVNKSWRQLGLDRRIET
jgi:hypothetical protein